MPLNTNLNKRIVSPETREKLRKASTGKHPSLETRKKRSISLMGNTNGIGAGGWKHSKEAIQKIKEKRKLQIFSDETREKMRKNHRGMLGKHHSLETIEKIKKSTPRN